MENAISVMTEIMNNQFDAGRAGKARPENMAKVKEALGYLLEAVREDSLHHVSEEEIQSLGLWCGANLSFIQAEMDSQRPATESFRGSGTTLYHYLLEYGWTPPSPK